MKTPKSKIPNEAEKVTVLKSNVKALADNIATPSEIGKALNKSGLKERTILLLIRDITGDSLDTIQRVLDALPQLEKKYLK